MVNTGVNLSEWIIPKLYKTNARLVYSINVGSIVLETYIALVTLIRCTGNQGLFSVAS